GFQRAVLCISIPCTPCSEQLHNSKAASSCTPSQEQNSSSEQWVFKRPCEQYISKPGRAAHGRAAASAYASSELHAA
ncbi:hypothetical protein Dimus_037359, partial [Dionaea muscipula]